MRQPKTLSKCSPDELLGPFLLFLDFYSQDLYAVYKMHTRRTIMNTPNDYRPQSQSRVLEVESIYKYTAFSMLRYDDTGKQLAKYIYNAAQVGYIYMYALLRTRNSLTASVCVCTSDREDTPK